jgi:polysaccharide pyruvyl transferase CsaB
MTKEERENLSNFSFEIAKKYFSAEECARQTLNFYQKVIDSSKSINKETKIALCGYYGRGNFGDESILCEIKKQIKEASKKPTKILLIQSSAPFRIIPNLARADLFIFGGGSLLQNSTSNKSLIFYLTVIFTAKILCKRKIMLSNGFGPINYDGFFGKLLIEALKHALNTFSFISTRDKKSQELIGSLIPQRKIHLVFDPAMVYFAEQEDFNNRRLIFTKETSARIVPNPKQGKCNHKIIYIPGKRALSRAKISESQVSNLLKHLSKKLNAEIIIAALSREDEESANKIAQRMGHCKVAHINSRKQLIVLLKGAKICISQRYHGALYSFYCKTPTLVISNDPKMKTLCKELGSSASMPTNIFKNLEAFLLCAEREIELNSQIREEIHFKIIKRAAKTEQKMQKILRYFI